MNSMELIPPRPRRSTEAMPVVYREIERVCVCVCVTRDEGVLQRYIH